MKYIRTKDSIIPDLLNECFEKQPLSYQTLGIEPIKISDNIEELCDEFVSGERLICKSRLKQTCEMLSKEKVNIYGAIWTDKGLIYVAKMNQEGELELWQD